MLYLSEAVALPARTARPPPAETTAYVDCWITARLTFAGGERCISVCADHGQTLPAPRAPRYQKDLGQALFFDGSTPFLLARQKKWGRKGSRAKRPATNGKAHTQKRKKGETP